jgi:hypothetical protein
MPHDVAVDGLSGTRPRGTFSASHTSFAMTLRLPVKETDAGFEELLFCQPSNTQCVGLRA